jgi:hypothetical protein
MQPIAMQRVNDRVTPRRIAVIARRKINEDLAIGGVALQIAFQGFSVDRDLFQLAIKTLLQIRKRLNEIVSVRSGRRRLRAILSKRQTRRNQNHTAEPDKHRANTPRRKTAGLHSIRVVGGWLKLEW